MYNENNYTEEEVENLQNEPYYDRTLKYHSDTVSQIVFNPNK
jgi:hypothetical protein